MNPLSRALTACAGALLLASCGWGSPTRAAPPSTAWGSTPPGHFSGKFELVPLFSKGKPYIVNGHTNYALRNTLSFRLADGTLLTAPAGMPTDLASIPRAAWSIMPPDGPWAMGATIHDDCYKTHGSFVWVWRNKARAISKTFAGLTGRAPLTRAECDETLRQTMVALGVPAWKRIVIYEAVRVGGSQGWGS